MDSKRLTAAAIVATFGIPTVFAIFEVQDWRMPSWVAVALVVVLLVMATVATMVVVLEVGKLLVKVTRGWGWRSPIFRRDKPDPNQWLLDIAQEDADNPDRHLLILKQTITGRDLHPDTRRPWIELGFTLYNGGVHSILVGPVKGHAHFKGDQLVDPIEEAGGRSNKPRGHEHEYKLKQYLPRDVAEAIYDELRKTQRVRSLGLSKVTLEVRADTPEGKIVQMPLGSNDTFMMPD